jgi:uncharacterized protein
MGKLILLLFLALVGYLLVKGLKRPRRRGDPPGPRRDLPAERMVTCAHCGVNLPESESVGAGGRHYCSDEHRRLGG